MPTDIEAKIDKHRNRSTEELALILIAQMRGTGPTQRHTAQ